MNRKGKKVVEIVLAIVLVLLMAILFLSEKRNSKRQEEYIAQVNAEASAEQKKEEEQLSMKLFDDSSTWINNASGYSVEVVKDTEELISTAYISSALFSNAKISWNLDIDKEQNYTYAWRFAISTEATSKKMSLFDGVNNCEYTIRSEKTIFYIPVVNNFKLSIEQDGRGNEFSPTNIYDIQLVRISGNSFPLSGQYLEDDHAQEITENVRLEYSSKLENSNYQCVSILENIGPQNLVKVDGDKVSFDMSFPFEPLDTNSETGIIQLAAYTKLSSGKIQIDINNAYSATRYLTTQAQEYIFPIRNIGVVSAVSLHVELSYDDAFQFLGGKTYTTSISDTKKIPGGSFMIADYDEQVIGAENDTLPTIMDGVSDGKYLYAINNGTLVVYDIASDAQNPIQISKIDGIGDVREITFVNNRKAVAISARENGVYFVDVSEPSSPFIASHYDTLEFATGIYGYGNYVAICNRYWGVEIVDVSDIANPKYCSQVSNRKEYYDCCINGDYLYVSVWAQKCVEVYDLSDVFEPKYVSTIPLDGNAGGITVENGLMFVATGYHGEGDSTNEFSASYGTGNGLEIYDVSNPLDYRWLSTEKIDGRYYISGFDHWNVSVAGNRVYFSSVSNGVYIYDISKPYAPIRLSHIKIDIPPTSSNYKKMGNVSILPDGSDGSGKEIITNALPVNGFVYLMGNLEGTYIYADPSAKLEEYNSGILNGKEQDNHSIKSIKMQNFEVLQYIKEDATIYATATANDGNIYVACGSAGVAVVNDSLEEQYVVQTKGAAKDVIINGEYLYVAESEEGFAVYCIENNNLKEVGRCKANFSGETISTISLCGDRKHIIAQAGFTKVCTIDISNPENPVIVNTISNGNMYWRNLCTGNVIEGGGEELTAVFGSGIINWYDSKGDLYMSMDNELTGESDGAAAFGKFVLALKDQGYVYFDPLNINEVDLESIPIIKIEDVILRGKPAIKDNLMVVSYGLLSPFEWLVLQLHSTRDLQTMSFYFCEIYSALSNNANTHRAALSLSRLYHCMSV